MTTTTDPQSSPPSEGFRLSQLIYDTRYRSLTIQVIASMLIALGLAWLINNTIQNLEALGKSFSFGFLSSPSGYDINQRLVEYDSQATHARAALVGILNTLLVAFLGCVLATILGVIVGVLRLSHNWLVSRVMAVYVEGFRNVPLLLWILLIFAIMTESMPRVRDFRPDGEASMSLFGLVAVTNQGTFIPRMGWSSGSIFIVLTLLVSIGAVVYMRRWARRKQEATGEQTPLLPYALGILIVPTVLSFFAVNAFTTRSEQNLIVVNAETATTLEAYAEEQGRMTLCYLPDTARSVTLMKHLRETGVAFRYNEYLARERALREMSRDRCSILAVPAADAQATIDRLTAMNGSNSYTLLDETLMEGNAIEPFVPKVTESGIPNFEGGTIVRNQLIALWLALSLYTSAFIAEIVRAGILSVSKGQTEAAFALGIRPGRTMRLVILPQALRVIIPPLISQYLNLTKNSSLALAVGYMDVRSTLGGITVNQTGRELEGILLLGLFYLVVSLGISTVMNIYNNAVKLKER